MDVGLAAAAERLGWQHTLFAAEPERGALIRLKANWPLSPRLIRFHRNHAIESALSATRPFLQFAGIEPEFVVGDYDDSLTFATEGPADVEVVWLDYTRFTDRLEPEGIAEWLLTRLEALRGRTSAPILVLDWDGPRKQAATFAARLGAGAPGVGAVRIASLRGAARAARRELFRR